MSDRANTNPELLKWARETAKISHDGLAKSLGVKVEKVVEWEAGESLPTIKQAQNFAKYCRRSFALFFLPEPPKDFSPITDFRASDALELSTASVFIIREILRKQKWIRDEIVKSGEEPREFVGRFKSKDTASQVSKDILKTLNIDPCNYESDNILLEWIRKAESQGIFVSRSSNIHSKMKLDPNEFKGFAIADKYAPFVFINSADWKASQLFTLVHELCHLWMARSGISNTINEPMADPGKYHPVELFCNEVAARTLLPTEIMHSLPPNTFSTQSSIFKESRKIGVSSLAFIIRARNIGLINMTQYRTLSKALKMAYEKELLKLEEQRNKKKEKGKLTGPSPYLLRLNRNSALFTQKVIDWFNGGRINPTTASNMLEVKSNMFSKLIEKIN